MANIDENVREKARRVVDALARGRWMIGTSESVTGGAIAAALAGVDGCSVVLFASQVPYSVPGKVTFLGVAPGVIEQHGTVSRHVIEAMHASMAAKFSSALAPCLPGLPSGLRGFVSVAITGVAGTPVEGKPAGHVLLGINVYKVDGQLMSLDATRIHALDLGGTRHGIIAGAVDAALEAILQCTAGFQQDI